MLVTHAHFDHLHRPSLRAIARATKRKTGRPPVIIVPQNVRKPPAPKGAWVYLKED